MDTSENTPAVRFRFRPRVALAVFAWITFAAATPSKDPPRASHTRVDDKLTKPLMAIATAVERLDRPTPADVGCYKGSDDRRSDLCAQWKAADAAASSAASAFWFGLFGLLIGVATTAAAAIAAAYARKAYLEAKRSADETKRGADEARRSADIAEAAQRAWLEFSLQKPTVSIDTSNVHAHPRGINTVLTAVVDNLGTMPATNVQLVAVMMMHAVFHKLPDLSSLLDAEELKFSSIPGMVGARSFPGKQIVVRGNTSIDNDALQAFIQHRGIEAWITLAVRVFYDSGKHRRHTDHYFQVAGPPWDTGGLSDMLQGLNLTLSSQPQGIKEISGGSLT